MTIAKWKSLQICSDFNKETVSSELLVDNKNNAGIRKKKNRFSLSLIKYFFNQLYNNTLYICIYRNK